MTDGDTDVVTTSPIPQKVEEKQVKVLMDFPEAIRAVSEGKKTTKEEWGDEDFFVELKDGMLRLHKPDGIWYVWQITDGDFNGEDWYAL